MEHRDPWKPAPVLRIAVLLGLLIAPGRQASLAAEPCKISPGDWSPVERHVWSDFICLGKPADLSKLSDGERALSGAFLQSVLQQNPWRRAIPWTGVAISGAHFTDAVTLNSGDFDKSLHLEDCTFAKDVFLSQARFKKSVWLDGSHFKRLLLNGLVLDGSLYLRRVEAEALWMNGADVSGHVYLSESKFARVFMDASRIKGDVVLFGTKANLLEMIGIDVTGTVNIARVTLREPLDLRYANVKGNLEINSGALPGFTLVGGTVSGEISLGNAQELTWTDPAAKADLRNARAKTIQMGGVAWPPKLDLRDFKYEVFDYFADADSHGYQSWLERSEPFSPQPYYFLSHLLADRGEIIASRDLLYAAEKKLDAVPRSYLAYAFNTALDWAIGYGYHIEWVWVPIVAFLVLGMIVVRLSGEATKYALGSGFWFSFDLLLPLVRLRELHYTIDLRSGVRHYFYIHKLMGYVLASFVVAGLGHLAK